MKEAVIKALRHIQQSWELSNVKWDFKIIEFSTKTHFVEDSEVSIAITAGKGITPMILYKQFYTGDNGIEKCWERIANDMLLGGIDNAYKTIVQMHRNNSTVIMDRNKDAFLYPLTTDEAFKNEL